MTKQILSRELRVMGSSIAPAAPSCPGRRRCGLFYSPSPLSWRLSPREQAAPDRNLVWRERGPHRPEEQDHAALGETRAHGRPRRTISAQPRPISSARSVRRTAGRSPRPTILQGTEAMALHLEEIAAAVCSAHTPFSSLHQWDGTLRRLRRRPTLPFCHCRRNRPNLNPVENVW